MEAESSNLDEDAREAAETRKPDLAGLIAALSGAGVRFVVIGGIAVAAHRVIRATEDLDLVPDPAHTNLDALSDVLVELDAGSGVGPSTWPIWSG